MSITRLVKLPLHNDVLVGRDLAKIFKSGHVYDIVEVDGEYIIRDIGITALEKDGKGCRYPTYGSTISAIACSGQTYRTIEEHKRVKAHIAMERRRNGRNNEKAYLAREAAKSI